MIDELELRARLSAAMLRGGMPAMIEEFHQVGVESIVGAIKVARVDPGVYASKAECYAAAFAHGWVYSRKMHCTVDMMHRAEADMGFIQSAVEGVIAALHGTSDESALCPQEPDCDMHTVDTTRKHLMDQLAHEAHSTGVYPVLVWSVYNPCEYEFEHFSSRDGMFGYLVNDDHRFGYERGQSTPYDEIDDVYDMHRPGDDDYELILAMIRRFVGKFFSESAQRALESLVSACEKE